MKITRKNISLAVGLVVVITILVYLCVASVFAPKNTADMVSLVGIDSVTSKDGKKSAFIDTITKEGEVTCNFHLINNENQQDSILKTVTDTDVAVCQFYRLKSFSPDGKYLLIDFGTSPIRTLEIINTENKKSIAKVTSNTGYGWFNGNEFLYGDVVAFKNSEDMRPWGGGEGFGITKINLTNGYKTVLKKTDSTHDYAMEINPDGTLVGDTKTVWIVVSTYLESGNHRFDQPDISHWIMNEKGILIKNNDGYETYK